MADSELDRIEEAFHRLVDLPPEARAGALAELASREGERIARAVEELLGAADLAGTPLDAPSAGIAGDRAPAATFAPAAPLEITDFESAAEIVPVVPGFRIVRRLGRGGSASVWLAEQERPDFSRPVALKLIDRIADPVALRRVADERRILARLEHPGIARLYDAGIAPSGQPFLAMERVDGETIVEHCRARELPVGDRLRLFLEVLDAVDYAHRAGIVHRDLKPANILVARDGGAKLLDFGIAKLFAAPGEDEETRTLARAMTPAYASPEQVRGDRVTVASDVYSLGVVLYELLAERLPYRLEGTPYETFEDAVRGQEPGPPSAAYTPTRETLTAATAASAIGSRFDPERHRRALRGDLDAVVLKALRKEPGARYGSVAELAGDLRRVLADEPVAARGSDRRYRLRRAGRRLAKPLLFVLAATAIAAVAVWIARRNATPESGAHAADELAAYYALESGDSAGRRRLREGAVELRAGRVVLARDDFEAAAAALAGGAGEILAYDGGARAELAAGEIGRAAALARRASELVATSPEAAEIAPDERDRIVARALASDREWERAVPALDRLFGRLPERADVGLDLVAALLASGQTAAADGTLGRILQLPAQAAPGARDPRVDLVEAEVAFRLGELQRSAAAAARARERSRAPGLEALALRAARVHAEALVRLDLYAEAAAELEPAAASADRLGLRREAARARLVLGKIAAHSAETARTRTLAEAARDALHAAGDAPGESMALSILAFEAAKRRDVAASVELADAAIAIAAAAGDRWCEGEALVYRLVIANWSGDAAGVATYRERALKALRDSENRHTLLATLDNLAVDAVERRELDQAEAWLDEARGLARRIGTRLADAGVDRAHGFLEESRRAWDRARSDYESALAKARRAGTAVPVATYLADLAGLELAADRPEAAEARADEAIAALQGVGRASDAADLLGIRAWAAARRGDRAEAEARLAVRPPESETSFAALTFEAATREALGDWELAIAARKKAIRVAEEGEAPGPRFEQRLALARDLDAAGQRVELEALARELQIEAEKFGDRVAAEELRTLLARRR